MSLRSHPSLDHCSLSRIFPLSPLQTSNHAICRDQCNVNGGSLVQKEKEKKLFSFLLRPLSKLSLGFCAVIVQCQAPSGEGPVWTCTGAQVPPQICVWGLFSWSPSLPKPPSRSPGGGNSLWPVGRVQGRQMSEVLPKGAGQQVSWAPKAPVPSPSS